MRQLPGILTHKGAVYVEAEVFEKMKTRKPMSLTGYRWESTQEKAENLLKAFKAKSLKPGLFFSDEKIGWSSPWIKTQVLVKMKLRLSAPFINISNNPKKKNLESIVSGDKKKPRSNAQFASFLKKNGLDSYIYVPISKEGTRQGILGSPNTQVKSMEIVPNVDHNHS